MFYEFLNKYLVKKGPLGPIVLRSNILLPLTQNVGKYRVEENSPVERSMAVGLWATKPAVMVDETYTQASGAVFDSAFLVLRHRNTEVYQKIALEQIRLANEQGRPYFINLPGTVNLSESTLFVPDNATVVANTAIELQVDYVEVSVS